MVGVGSSTKPLGLLAPLGWSAIQQVGIRTRGRIIKYES
uniref:Uncharacterized protein n=1 Tax=Utricularia reniformis TaxID=192314 RepID=A0A1Y0B210_9LAMI|nr:hypothetical protein AEK19_MT1214 [Utricularia reniformis]ART31428.1 hypothetical protein AEK19_MT1214 [Utricularia reniformis]